MTSAWSAAPAPVERILKVVRFGIVGIAATATYLAVAILLPAIGAASPATAALVASGVSVFVSYFGHHTFTFARKGRHDFYLPRFLLQWMVLTGAASLGTYVLTDILAMNYRLAAVLVALAYAASSFVANNIGVFRDG